jgi:uncharacterized protein (DUF1697 family)
VTTWVLLLRAVNVGGRNRLAMADLRALLTDLGHDEVGTVLNSGNATFTSRRRARATLISEIENGLRDRLDLDVGVTLRTRQEVQAVLDEIPEDIARTSYVLVTFLFDPPTAAAVQELGAWDVSPERLVVADGVVYLGYSGPMNTSALQNAALEKRAGVRATARTPATLRKLLA